MNYNVKQHTCSVPSLLVFFTFIYNYDISPIDMIYGKFYSLIERYSTVVTIDKNSTIMYVVSVNPVSSAICCERKESCSQRSGFCTAQNNGGCDVTACVSRHSIVSERAGNQTIMPSMFSPLFKG